MTTATSSIPSLAGDSHPASLSLTQQALRRLRRDPLTLAAAVILLVLMLLSLFAPLIVTNMLQTDYFSTSVSDRFLPMGTPGHVLGTDSLGRDVLARLLYGGQVSLSVAALSAGFSLIVGVTLGLIAGFNQGGTFGFIDDLLLWFITTLNSIPSLYLLVMLSAVLRPTVLTLVLVISLFSWTFTMRLTRGQTLSIREQEYVVAARAMGASPWRIMRSHILPNLVSILTVDLASNIAALILTESALSFLGLGVREPTPSWGNMLSSAQSYFREAAHLVILPGMLIVITVLCLFLIGDGLRDAFDPQSKK
ncbi:MAG: ABC transporter permease [bacterium]|nr:ABC transporter permease [bacterium]